MAEPELGSLPWWDDWQHGGHGIRQAGRRLARTLHSAYHAHIASEQAGVLWEWQDRDGHLHQTMVSRLEMERAIQGAVAWCQNNFGDKEPDGGHGHVWIARRLPREWAKDATRWALALRCFRQLCQGRIRHYGEKARLAAEVGLSVDTLDNRRLDFFLVTAALALDDDAWEAAMMGEELPEREPGLV